MTITEQLAKITQEIAEGKHDTIFDDYFKKMEEQDAKYKLFFEQEFKTKFNLLKAHLVETQASVIDYEFHYTLSFITNEDFWTIFECIHRHTDTKLVEDSLAVFPTSGFVYDGVIFEITSGQGTILKAMLSPNNKTTYPPEPEFVICINDNYITGVYRNGQLIATDLNDPSALLHIMGHSADCIYVADSSELPKTVEELRCIV